MRPSPRQRLSRRQRNIVTAVAVTLAGTAAMTVLAVWAEANRETDLADARSGVTSVFKEAGGAVPPPLAFRDVAAAAGLVMDHGPGARARTLPEDTGSGLAWGDYDGDGDWDLYAVNFASASRGTEGPDGSNRLFRNDGGRFVDVASQAGVADPNGFGMGAGFADYDADGDLDLFVTNIGPNRLFRNRGDGTFEDVAAEAGVADPLWSLGAAWGDFDRDGHLDLYVCNYVDYDTSGSGPDIVVDTAAGSRGVPFTLNPNSFDPQPNRLYRNRGNETFEDVAEPCGVSNPDGRSMAATFCDLDGDGWLDLYVNNDVSPNRLFRNLGCEPGRGPPRFADISTLTGTADPRGSMGLSVGEVGEMSGNADGLPDLFLTNWIAQEDCLYQSVRCPGGLVEYRDKTRLYRLGEITLDTVGWGCAFADLDLDGRLDLAVANGSTLEHRDDPSRLMAEPLFLFWNDGRHFQDAAPGAGDAASAKHCARGLAAADYDRDGDVDLAVSVNRGRLLLLRNDTHRTHPSLTVALRGRAAACFGARVEVLAAGRRQVRWWGADVSYLSMHAPDLVFGLGTAQSAESVRVLWADGKESELRSVAAGTVEVVHP